MYSARRSGCGISIVRSFGCLSQIIVLLVILAVLYYGSYLFARGPVSEAPVIIARDTSSELMGATTLVGLRDAVAGDADWLKIDLQMTDDGELVALRNREIQTRSGMMRVADLMMSDLALLAPDPLDIPITLESALAFAQRNDRPLFIETRFPDRYPGMEIAILEAIEKIGYRDRTLIASTSRASLEQIGELSPDQPICPIYGLGTLSLSTPYPSDAAYLCPMAEMVLISPWMVRQAHRNEREVLVWSAWSESPFVLRLLVEIGVDGVIVADPDALNRVVEGR